MRYVECEKPNGCGWWWIEYLVGRGQMRKRIYYGPFWQCEGVSGGAPRKMTRAELEGEYADCIAHLATHLGRPPTTCKLLGTASEVK
jgi:hypothetical protein